MKYWLRSIQSTVACISVPCALAAPPQAYDQWSIGSNDNISATCPSGFSCETVVSGNGFLQQNLTNESGGDDFFHTVMVTEAADQQSFIDENFVRQSDNPNPLATGIFDKQSISFAQTTKVADSQFDMNTQLRPGWDSTNTEPNVEINQNINEASRKMYFGNKFYEGDYSLDTYIAINTDANGVRTGYLQELDQRVKDPGQLMQSNCDLTDDGCRKDNVEGTGGFYAEIDTQVFALRRKSGDYTSAGSATLSGGRSISWQAGHDIRAYLVGNAFHHSRTTQDGGSGISLQNTKDDFAGYQTVTMNMVGYDNLTTVDSINYFEFADTQPNNWDQDFGPAPSVPRPTGLAGTGKDNIYVGRTGPAPKQVSGLFTPTAVGSKHVGEGLPFSFDRWVVMSGEILAECFPGATCPNGGIGGFGMNQRIISSADGRQFIQSLITDTDANGTPSTVDFASESFIRMGGGNTVTNTSEGSNTNQTAPNGIALRQIIRSDDLSTANRATQTDLTVEIRTGWASESDIPNVVIDMTIEEQFQTGGYLTHNFDYMANLDIDGFVTGSATDIYTEGKNTARAYSTDYRDTTDTIQFMQIARGGDMVTSSGSESRCVAERNPERCQSFSWQPGDYLSATRYNVTSSIKEQSSGWETLVLEDNLVDNRRMSNEFIRKDGGPGWGTFLTGGTNVQNND